MYEEDQSAVHAGNYYRWGSRRLLSKLTALGLEVPSAALEVVPHNQFFEVLSGYTKLDHALMDWFGKRDYTQAQALIHYRPAPQEWFLIRELIEDNWRRSVGCETLFASLNDAIACVVADCDSNVQRLESVRKEGGSICVKINGVDTCKIERVLPQPFDVSVRDRVRSAIKGVREHDTLGLLRRAQRLPGFSNLNFSAHFRATSHREDSCLLFGFPTNWAVAMRSALKQVGIQVRQSQAQELVAVFFGASNWHQLVKHQDCINAGNHPIAVDVDADHGKQQRFYWTAEEAFFAVGGVLHSYPEPLVVTDFSLNLFKSQIAVAACSRHEYDAKEFYEKVFCASRVASRQTDYHAAADHSTDGQIEAAQRIVESLVHNDSAHSVSALLYDDVGPKGLLTGLLAREGLPANNLVYIGEHAVAVFLVPEPNGSALLASQVRIYRIEEQGPVKVAEVAMYKAEITVKQDPDEHLLIISPDYGNGSAPAIEIRFKDLAQARALFALTHAKNRFMHTVPEGMAIDHDDGHHIVATS
ncbi:hypothetical protein [Duganella vulcania]|uniref:Uncharacterized protein n=1 Tax=Duganella vulcania TaxID=2692166 RepID=A0A845GFU3_9BURK|nr:hypothetical protein [Duganella vulcania]MYM92821.1 hypothetical protein [Duganella vulcania]